MKKLLSAVTSAVMGLSLMTSVFASSLSVSAAGGFSAEQPNASLSEALDVTANKDSSAGVVLNYLYEDGLDYIQVQPGDTEVYADLMINSNGQAIMSVDMGINISDPFEFTYISEFSDAFNCGLTSNWMGNPANSEVLVDPDGNPVDAKFNGTLGKTNGVGSDASYDPQVPATDKSFAYFTFDVPADCPEGYYYIDLAYIQLNKDRVPNAFTADEINYTPCKIRVGNPDDPDPNVTTTTTTATTPTKVTTTTVTTPAASDDTAIILDYKYADGLDYYAAEPGDIISADLMIDSNGQEVMSVDMGVTVDDPLSFDYVSDFSNAFSCGLTVN